MTEDFFGNRRVGVLFVCMGNICRSPTAEGIFRKLVLDRTLGHAFDIDSAGTHAYHVGNTPDPRAQASAKRRGVDISRLRARRVEMEDFERFDYILAMDEENLENLIQQCPQEHAAKIRLFLDYAPHVEQREVPDPYYGGLTGFERVLDLIEAAAEGLLCEIEGRHLGRSRI